MAKFRDYFDYAEPIANGAIAPRAGGVPRRALESSTPSWRWTEDPAPRHDRPLAEGRIAAHLGWRHAGRAGDELMRKCVAWTWKVKLSA